MRLIDADLLRKQFSQRELERNGRYMNGTMISNIRKIIDEAPTVELDGKLTCLTCQGCGFSDTCDHEPYGEEGDQK